MQTIIKFLANGGKVHVSFVTLLHFLDFVSFKLIADWPAVATTNVNDGVHCQCGQTNKDNSRTDKIATK